MENLSTVLREYIFSPDLESRQNLSFALKFFQKQKAEPSHKHRNYQVPATIQFDQLWTADQLRVGISLAFVTLFEFRIQIHFCLRACGNVMQS